MRVRLLAPLLAVIIAGCATTSNYNIVLDAFVGATEVELVQSWGVPTQTYESNGHRFLLYSDQRSLYIPGTSPTYTTQFIGNTAYTNVVGGTPASYVTLTCATTFEIVSGRVVSWSWEGNDCIAQILPTDLCSPDDTACIEAARVCLRQRPDSLAALTGCLGQYGF